MGRLKPVFFRTSEVQARSQYLKSLKIRHHLRDKIQVFSEHQKFLSILQMFRVFQILFFKRPERSDRFRERRVLFRTSIFTSALFAVFLFVCVHSTFRSIPGSLTFHKQRQEMTLPVRKMRPDPHGLFQLLIPISPFRVTAGKIFCKLRLHHRKLRMALKESCYALLVLLG